MAMKLKGTPLVPGATEGRLLVSSEPLSFWGGYDQYTGEVIDRRHPLSGTNGAGRVLAIPFTRGSSTTTAILLESIRAGVAPAAILTRETDSFLALASIVADEMYQRPLPVIALSPSDFDLLETGPHAVIQADGAIEIKDGG